MSSQIFHDAVNEHPWAVATSAAVVSLTAAYLQSPSWKVRATQLYNINEPYKLIKYSQLRSIPTIGGSSLPLLSYIGARRHFDHVTEWYEEGYNRHQGGFFKIPTLDRWMGGSSVSRSMHESNGHFSCCNWADTHQRNRWSAR
jgi:hypothetical protein